MEEGILNSIDLKRCRTQIARARGRVPNCPTSAILFYMAKPSVVLASLAIVFGIGLIAIEGAGLGLFLGKYNDELSVIVVEGNATVITSNFLASAALTSFFVPLLGLIVRRHFIVRRGTFYSSLLYNLGHPIGIDFSLLPFVVRAESERRCSKKIIFFPYAISVSFVLAESLRVGMLLVVIGSYYDRWPRRLDSGSLFEQPPVHFFRLP